MPRFVQHLAAQFTLGRAWLDLVYTDFRRCLQCLIIAIKPVYQYPLIQHTAMLMQLQRWCEVLNHLLIPTHSITSSSSYEPRLLDKRLFNNKLYRELLQSITMLSSPVHIAFKLAGQAMGRVASHIRRLNLQMFPDCRFPVSLSNPTRPTLRNLVAEVDEASNDPERATLSHHQSAKHRWHSTVEFKHRGQPMNACITREQCK
jgi:hypothetical protein